MRISKLFSLLLIAVTTTVTGQEFEWVKTTNESEIFPSVIATDDEGNIYSVGRFVFSPDFDPGPAVYTLSAYFGSGDIFIRKLDTDGNFLWAKSIYGSGNNLPNSLSVSPDGSEIYISGYFQGSADFDPGVDSYLLTNVGADPDLFALKLNGEGEFEWAFNVPGNFDPALLKTAIRRASDGTVIFSGVFTGIYDFDPDPGLGETFVMNAGDGHACFVQKLSSAGDFIWANRLENVVLTNACYDGDLNILLTGNFSGTVDFDVGPDTTMVDAEGTDDGFILSEDEDGNFNWVKTLHGTSMTRPEYIQVDYDGNILCSGSYTNNTDFDPGVPEYILISNGNFDHFFMKLDDLGNFIWAKSIGNSYTDGSRGILCNLENEIYIAGISYGEEIDLDPGADEVIIPNFGSLDFYIEKLDTDGNLIWWKNSNGIDGENITSMAKDSEDQLYIVGQFSKTIDYDFCEASVYELTYLASGSPEYILKLSYCQVYGDTIEGEGCKFYIAPNGVMYTESGTYYETFESVCHCDSIVPVHVTIWNISYAVDQDGATLTAIEDDPAASYQWVNCEDDYEEIPGATEQVFVAPEDGEYAVIISAGPCVDTSNCLSVATQNIKNEEVGINALIYPNPTSGFCIVDLGNKYQRIELKVYNVTGELIADSAHESVEKIELLLNYAAGLYFIEINTEEGLQTFLKILVE